MRMRTPRTLVDAVRASLAKHPRVLLAVSGGIDSMALLRQVVTLVQQRGFVPRQADITVICEAPRLSAHAASIATAVAGSLGLEPGSVGLKAKSNEGMGFIGRGEGLAVMAVVTVEAR